MLMSATSMSDVHEPHVDSFVQSVDSFTNNHLVSDKNNSSVSNYNRHLNMNLNFI